MLTLLQRCELSEYIGGTISDRVRKERPAKCHTEMLNNSVSKTGHQSSASVGALLGFPGIYLLYRS